MKCSKLHLILQMFSFALLLTPLSLPKCSFCWYINLGSFTTTDVLTGYCSQKSLYFLKCSRERWSQNWQQNRPINEDFHEAPPHSLSPNSCQIQGSSLQVANHMASLNDWKNMTAMPWLFQIKEFSTALVNYVVLKDRFTHWREKKKLILGIWEINQ